MAHRILQGVGVLVFATAYVIPPGCASEPPASTPTSVSSNATGATVTDGSSLTVLTVYGTIENLPPHGDPLKVGDVRLEQYRLDDGRFELLRNVLRDPDHPDFRLLLDDDIKLFARITGNGLWYLAIVEPSGSVRRGLSDHPPLLRSLGKLEYPAQESMYYGLTHGTGTHAFILVGTHSPLPADSNWWTEQTSHWNSVEGVWQYDSQAPEPFQRVRGIRDPRRRTKPAIPEGFRALCESLDSLEATEVVYGIAFHVGSP
ncbi:MAG: hypothetical protein AAFX79_08135 [Planctomycetota bacterium]